MILYNLQY